MRKGKRGGGGRESERMKEEREKEGEGWRKKEGRGERVCVCCVFALKFRNCFFRPVPLLAYLSALQPSLWTSVNLVELSVYAELCKH